jgi:DNA-binding transcriptional regulator YhcF (GntR family)
MGSDGADSLYPADRWSTSASPRVMWRDMFDRRFEIAEVIRQRIVSGLHLGTVGPGSRLPSTRDIVHEFAVSPRTAMAAYRVLEGEGLVELRERSGIYVAASRPSAGAMLTQLAGWVVTVLLDARSREIPPVDFPERVRRCLETLRLCALCVAGNVDQLEQICRELHDDYGFATDTVEPRALERWSDDAQHAIRRADILVSTSVYTHVTQRAAARLNKPALTVSLRPDFIGEMRRHLERGPIYIIGTDPRFRDAVHAVFAPLPGGGNAHAVILGEDDLAAIPEEAPTYIMRTAHQRLGDAPLAKRVVPVRRVFSNDMARELLTFVVRANIAAMAARPA